VVESLFFAGSDSLAILVQRRFLQLLVNHEWDLEPLVVDVNGDLTTNDYTKIMVR